VQLLTIHDAADVWNEVEAHRQAVSEEEQLLVDDVKRVAQDNYFVSILFVGSGYTAQSGTLDGMAVIPLDVVVCPRTTAMDVKANTIDKNFIS
jgi:hypothetical protein